MVGARRPRWFLVPLGSVLGVAAGAWLLLGSMEADPSGVQVRTAEAGSSPTVGTEAETSPTVLDGTREAETPITEFARTTIDAPAVPSAPQHVDPDTGRFQATRLPGNFVLRSEEESVGAGGELKYGQHFRDQSRPDARINVVSSRGPIVAEMRKTIKTFEADGTVEIAPGFSASLHRFSDGWIGVSWPERDDVQMSMVGTDVSVDELLLVAKNLREA